MSFAEELKKYRNTAGLSKQTLADRMSIPLRTIEDWEAGRREPAEYLQRFVLQELETIVSPEYPFIVCQRDKINGTFKTIGSFVDKYHAEVFVQSVVERELKEAGSTNIYEYTVKDLRNQG